MKKNIFVIGPDHFNMKQLKTLRKADAYAFHPLLAFNEVKHKGPYDLPGLLAKATHRLETFPGRIDAIVGYWDFPVSSMLPLLRQQFGLPSPTPAAVAKCEHKYWSRVEQRRVLPECTPRFSAVDPFADALQRIDVNYPFWIKPVKSLRSYLAFRIGNARDLSQAIPLIRDGIPRIAAPFNHFLAHVEMPDEIRNVDGGHCIAEALIGGRQCTLEGYAFENDICIYGIIDSFRLPNRTTFTRYEYPSRLPARIQRRMQDAAVRFIHHIGFDNSPFNMEFFYDSARDRITILEVNPRQSQSHGKLFEKVAGVSNHEVMVDIALGRAPDFPHDSGPFNCAAKFFLRRKKDATVLRVPGKKQIADIRQRLPGTEVEIHVRVGDRLSDLYDQDSYSYEIANIYIGAMNRREMLRKHRRCLEQLDFAFSESDPPIRPAPSRSPHDPIATRIGGACP